MFALIDRHKQPGHKAWLIAAVICIVPLSVLDTRASTSLLVVGDSITEGALSASTGGYRLFLDQEFTSRGFDYSWTGGRYAHGNGAGQRGRFVQGNAYLEIPGELDPIATMNGSSIDAGFQPWNRHYGIGAITANDPDANDYATPGGVVNGVTDFYQRETYSVERRMLDRWLDFSQFDPSAAHAGNQNAIRDPNTNSGIGDFQLTVFGTDGNGDYQVPNTVITTLGTNSLGPVSPSTVLDAAIELRDMLNAYELLQAKDYFGAETRFLVAQIVPRATSSIPWTLSATALEQSFDYNALIEDPNSIVYEHLDASFKNQIEVVDFFRIHATQAYSSSQAVRDAAAAVGLSTKTAFSAAVDPDGDVWVDWVFGIDEADRSSLAGVQGYNTQLIADRVHPTSLGYSLMGYQASHAVTGDSVIDLLGDLNGDDEINTLDWQLYRNGFGSPLSGLPPSERYAMGDLDLDGDNDIDDFGLFKSAYMLENGTSSLFELTQVPEPGPQGMAIIAAFLISVTVRRSCRSVPTVMSSRSDKLVTP